MVKDAVVSYLTAFGIDLGIFVALFCVFAFYRKIRTKRVDPPEGIEPQKEPPVEEDKLTFQQIILKAYSFNDDQIIELCGLEAFLYLKFIKIVTIMLAIMSVFGMAVLAPIYWYGTNDLLTPTVLQKITISHIVNDPDTAAAPTVFIFFYTVIAYICAFRYYKAIKTYTRMLNFDSESVIVIYGLDRNKSASEHETIIREKLKDCREIGDIYVVPDYTKAFQLKQERDVHKEALLKYNLLNEKEEKRQVIHSKFFTRKVDAVAFHTAELVRIKMEFDLAFVEA